MGLAGKNGEGSELSYLDETPRFIRQRKPIFPVDRATKKPAVEWKVYQDRPPSKAEIMEWQRNKPGANIGMATGHLSNVVVIDCDSTESINRFINSYPEAQCTRQVATGRGRHFYFQHCDGVRNDAGRLLGAGIDVRGEGGFVVVPPSTHANGKQYQYINRNRPIPLPDRLKEVLSPKGNGSNGSHVVEQPIKDGQRNDTLASMAGAMRRKGMSQDAMAAALQVENASRCDPTLPEAEVDKIARSIARYEPEIDDNGQIQTANLTSAYRDPPSEVRFEREVNLGELQTRVMEMGVPVLNCLPVLGQEKLIVNGWSHILASYPKTGKTELMIRVIAEWPNERILYFTEEPESVWDARMKGLPQTYDHVTLYYGLGVKPAEILGRIKAGNETIVIIDTVRNLLGLKDENDNSEVSRALIPFIAAARDRHMTLIALHHDRKGGGENGEGIAGAHAFLGVVDIALEVTRSGPSNSRRRLLKGWGRVIEIPELTYELREDNTMVALGSPTEVTLGAVKDRVLPILGDELEKTRDIKSNMGDPVPSDDQMVRALEALANEGKAERDPPMSAGKRSGVTYRWRKNLTSDDPPPRAEVRFGGGQDGDNGMEAEKGEIKRG